MHESTVSLWTDGLPNMCDVILRKESLFARTVSLKFLMTDYFPSGWVVNVHTHTHTRARW